jgi:hypothetical protein
MEYGTVGVVNHGQFGEIGASQTLATTLNNPLVVTVCASVCFTRIIDSNSQDLVKDLAR